MTNLEFCKARRKAETPAFIRVLKAVPKNRLDYRPDPKARTAAELAWLFAVEEAALVALLKDGVVEWKESKPPAGIDEIVSSFEKSVAEVNNRLEKVTEAAWDKNVKLLLADGTAWEDTLGQMFWGFLFDAIHHRGQLSTYLRPMGSKVPSIYGPTADDPGK